MRKISQPLSIIFLAMTLYSFGEKTDVIAAAKRQIVGTWRPTYNGQAGETDYLQFNADGSGLDTRLINSSTIYLISFSWKLDDQYNIIGRTTAGPMGHYSYIDDSNHIESITASTMVIKDVHTGRLDTLKK